MTPEEKAKELIKKCRDAMTGPGIEANDRNAPVLALIMVNEVISQLDEMCKPEYVSFWHGDNTGETQDGYFIKEYWEEVKQQIENL